MAKRLRFEATNKLESINSSDESDAYGENQYEESSDPDVEIRKYQSRRKPKCFSRNAQMARKNRLKKKIHLAKLEKKVEVLRKEKNDLSNVINSQSIMLSDLKKEVRYLKGVLANSSDICMLVRNIHENTRMPISLSMNSSLEVCTNDTSRDDCEDTPIKKDSFLSDSSSKEYNNLDNYNYPFDIDNDLYSYLNTTDPLTSGETFQQISPLLQEHNYTRLLVLLNYLEGLQFFFPMFNSSADLQGSNGF